MPEKVLLDKKVIAQVQIGGTGEPEEPTPTPTPPTPTPPLLPADKACYANFRSEHRRLREVIDREARNGNCITKQEMSEWTKIPEEIIDIHVDVMRIDNSIIPTSKDGELCTLPVLERLTEKLHKIVTYEW